MAVKQESQVSQIGCHWKFHRRTWLGRWVGGSLELSVFAYWLREIASNRFEI